MTEPADDGRQDQAAEADPAHAEPPQAEPTAVRYEREGAAALITIDRQHRRNAVDGPTAAALHNAYLRFEAVDRKSVV